MNRSYSKIRHIQESNIKLEQRLLKEQPVPPPTKGEPPINSQSASTTPQIKTYGKVELKNTDNGTIAYLNGKIPLGNMKGIGSLKPVDKLDLPAGSYTSIGNCGDFLICDNNKNFLGYIADNIGGCSRCGVCAHEYKLEILEDGTAKGGENNFVTAGTNYRKLEGSVDDILDKSSKEEGSESSESSNIKTVTNKVASEGIKNVTEEMITAPPFKGSYLGYVFNGTFNGVNYEWDCNGVEGMSEMIYPVFGKIITEHNSFLLSDNPNATRMGLKDDANPEGLLVGFTSPNTKFVIYYSKDKKYKCKYFR